MPIYRHISIIAIIVVAVLLFVVEQGVSGPLAQQFGAVPAVISQAWTSLLDGQFNGIVVRALSRLLTAMFLHGDIEHILYNMVYLWAFGILASEHLGKWWALAVFFFCGVCGNITQVVLNLDSPIPIIGASGAISGFEGLYLGLALRWQLPWPDVWPLAHPIPPLQLAAFAVLGFLFDLYSLMNHDQGIAYGAHAGGFVSGLILALIVTAVFRTQAAYRRGRWRR